MPESPAAENTVHNAGSWRELLAPLEPGRVHGEDLELLVDALVDAIGEPRGEELLNHLSVAKARYVGPGSVWATIFRRLVEDAATGALVGASPEGTPDAVGVREVFIAAVKCAPGNPSLQRYGQRLARLASRPAMQGSRVASAPASSRLLRILGIGLAACGVALAAVVLVPRIVFSNDVHSSEPEPAPGFDLPPAGYTCTLGERAAHRCAVERTSPGATSLEIDLAGPGPVINRLSGPLVRVDEKCWSASLERTFSTDGDAPAKSAAGVLVFCFQSDQWEGSWNSTRTVPFAMRSPR